MIYILIFIGFLGVIFLVQRFTQRQIQKEVDGAGKNNPLKKLSSALGLEFEELNSPSEEKTIYSLRSRAWGTYAGIPIEIRYTSAAEIGQGVNLRTYSYVMEKTITFTVKNPQKKNFSILPKSSGAVGGKATGHPLFDQNLLLVGDISLPNDILEYFGTLGWMHLTIKDNALIFHDTFYEQFQGPIGSMKIMNAVHPIWNTTVQSGQVDIERVKKFLDTLVKFIHSEDLV